VQATAISLRRQPKKHHAGNEAAQQREVGREEPVARQRGQEAQKRDGKGAAGEGRLQRLPIALQAQEAAAASDEGMAQQPPANAPDADGVERAD